tara:strand:- start:770 stop:1006 length:237 start_codon:yes stop_codon:yes gene_type:complete
MKLSKLYIDEDGYLMCGEPVRSTSMVEGLRLIPLNIEDGKRFDYEIIFINDLKEPCRGYAEMCENSFKIENEYVKKRV